MTVIEAFICAAGFVVLLGTIAFYIWKVITIAYNETTTDK